MKLPPHANLYRFNDVLDELMELATLLSSSVQYEDVAPIKFLCDMNKGYLKQIVARIVHLEMVMDEVIKLDERRCTA